jgi:hypothetical protein
MLFYLSIGLFSMYTLYKSAIIQEGKYLYTYLYSQQKSHLKTIQKCLELLSQFLYIYISQHFFYNSKIIKKNVYDIEYTINCKIYRFQIPYKKGPSKYLQFIDDNDQDVSLLLFSYVGPNDDFHQIKYKPSDFNFKSLTINYSDGSSNTFHENDVIF